MGDSGRKLNSIVEKREWERRKGRQNEDIWEMKLKERAQILSQWGDK